MPKLFALSGFFIALIIGFILEMAVHKIFIMAFSSCLFSFWTGYLFSVVEQNSREEVEEETKD